MPDDGIFRVASVSKPIVAVAALQLVEQGLLGLDAPVEGVLPELADRRVLLDPHGGLDQPSVPAERPLTLRDLLTFRSGLGMDFDFGAPQPVLERMWALGIGPGPTPPAGDPDEFMSRLGELPLSDQPGTRWRCHTGSDILSVLIERLRGEPLDAVLAGIGCRDDHRSAHCRPTGPSGHRRGGRRPGLGSNRRGSAPRRPGRLANGGLLRMGRRAGQSLAGGPGTRPECGRAQHRRVRIAERAGPDAFLRGRRCGHLRGSDGPSGLVIGAIKSSRRSLTSAG